MEIGGIATSTSISTIGAILNTPRILYSPRF